MTYHRLSSALLAPWLRVLISLSRIGVATEGFGEIQWGKAVWWRGEEED
jgi:hypothetical protein